ncbi:MAG: serine/threonine-protein kinase [Acidobacteriota bacterium]
MLASLNHPHIAAIYGFEESGDLQFLVLELIDGETLADRLSKGALRISDALAVAGQIAAALEAAHEKGIVHRDLKPANIGLTTDDQVKVLDFGLAKVSALAVENERDMADSPTITTPALMTGAGTILGTAAYMSPEQAKGREADRRSDLWALGVVLYELLTGRSPFHRSDIPETIAAVLTSDPDWSALPSDTPPAIRRLLARCLERDRRRRLGDAGEAAFQIEHAMSEPAGAAPNARASIAAKPWLPWTIAALLAVATVTAVAGWLRRAPPAPLALEARIEIAPDGDLARGAGGSPVAISPDGRVLAFITEGRRARTTARSVDSDRRPGRGGRCALLLPRRRVDWLLRRWEAEESSRRGRNRNGHLRRPAAEGRHLDE